MAAPRGIRPPASAARVAQAPGEATGLGQLSGLLTAVDGLVYAVSYGDGRWLVRDQTKDQRFGCGSLLPLRRPVLAVADRTSSIAPIGVQLVKYVLPLLNNAGSPAWGAGCSHRNRRGFGAGRPAWLWPPGRSPERNRGHRRQKDNGQRNVRRHQVLHNALPPVMDCGRRSLALSSGPVCPALTTLWTATAGGVRLTDELHRPRTAAGVRALPQGQVSAPGAEVFAY